MFEVVFDDNSKVQFNEGLSVLEVIKLKDKKLINGLCACKFNGELVDLNSNINENGKLELLTFDSPEGQKVYWHTSSHIVAQAVCRLFKNVKLGIGPAIENGFYYDFDLERPLTQEDLKLIEKECKRIINDNIKIVRKLVSVNEAISVMTDKKQDYKIELINELSSNGQKISFYKQGEFIDLCKGPHLFSTGEVGVIKLTSCTGAYWKGNSKNKMLQRIYGIAFPKKSQLTEYMAKLEEAKKKRS